MTQQNLLQPAIGELSKCSYDELDQLNDALRYHIAKLMNPRDDPKIPRHGKPQSAAQLYRGMLNSAGQLQTVDDTTNGPLRVYYYVLKFAEQLDQLEILQAAAKGMKEAIAPAIQRRDGTGYIENRIFARLRYNVDLQQFVIRYYGPYAYLRIWATGGGRDHKKRVLKSIYLGKEIAQLIENGDYTTDDITAAFHAGELADLKKQAKTQAIDLDPLPVPDPEPFQLDERFKALELTMEQLQKIFNDSTMTALQAGTITQDELYQQYIDKQKSE